MIKDRETILQLLRANRDELSRMGVRSLALFGSAARGELDPESDIDLLAGLMPPSTIDRYIRMQRNKSSGISREIYRTKRWGSNFFRKSGYESVT